MLINETGNGGPLWAGSALPIILIIVFASVTLLSIGYCFWAVVVTRQLWAWLGGLSIVCVLGNLGYILWWMIDNTPERADFTFYTTPHAGSVLALLGAVAVVIGSAIGKRAALDPPH